MGILRLLLAISVVFGHTQGTGFIDGHLAVQSFFLISGFYITMILKEKYQKISTFYLIRAARIYCTYLVCLALTIMVTFLVFGSINSFSNLQNSDLSIFYKLLFVFWNISIIGSESTFFLKPNENGSALSFTANFHESNSNLFDFLVISQSWTLSLEILFYLIAPIIVRKKYMVLIAMSISIAVRVLTYKKFSSGDPWDYRFFFNEISLFCLGALTYYYYRSISPTRVIGVFDKIAGILRINVYLMISLLVFINLKIAVFINNVYGQTLFSKYQLLPLNRIYFLITLIIFVPVLFCLTKDNLLDRLLGEYSFILYLIHLLVAQLYFKYFHTLDSLNITVASLILSVVIFPFTSKFEKYVRSRVMKVQHE